MNICIPIIEDKGLRSLLSAHFGSAPLFMIINVENGSQQIIPNRNLHHNHGMCQPLAALAGESIVGMIVGGIGRGALDKLQAANIPVFLSGPSTVEDILADFRAGKLPPVNPESACSHHGRAHSAG